MLDASTCTRLAQLKVLTAALERLDALDTARVADVVELLNSSQLLLEPEALAAGGALAADQQALSTSVAAWATALLKLLSSELVRRRPQCVIASLSLSLDSTVELRTQILCMAALCSGWTEGILTI